MTCSQAGIDLIRSFEGCRLEAYQDQRGIWTIGYGHTGPEVVACSSIIESDAEMMLKLDLSAAELAVSVLVTSALRQNQFDALVSLVYNIGRGAFAGSTLLKKLNHLDYAGAAAEFPKWDHTDGASNPGLLKRRLAEQALFSRIN